MVVAKDKKGKAHENRSKENLQIGVRTSDEANMPPTWLAQFAKAKLSGKETKYIKRGSQNLLRPLLWGWPTFTPPGYTLLCLLNKTLSCNWAVTLVCHFKSLQQQDRNKEITYSPMVKKCWVFQGKNYSCPFIKKW